MVYTCRCGAVYAQNQFGGLVPNNKTAAYGYWFPASDSPDTCPSCDGGLAASGRSDTWIWIEGIDCDWRELRGEEQT